MNLEELLGTLINAFAMYGLMWVIILFLLLISHISRDEPRPKNKDTDQTGSDSDY